MSDEWYLRFKSENRKITNLFNKLKKNKLIGFIKIEGKEANLAEVKTINHVDQINIGWYLSSYINLDKKRTTTVYVIGARKGIHKDVLKIIKIAGETLDPIEVSIIYEPEGPEPVYKGKWDFNFFKKEILPKIEWEKYEK